jgi:hypothetical protein
VDQQPTIPWLTYQDSRGNVIYGGKPMGRAPVSREFRTHAKKKRHRHRRSPSRREHHV